MFRRFSFVFALQLLSFAACAQTNSSLPAKPNPTQAIAFPGAEGFGKYTSGGRGGAVYVVSNLNDSGPGSLREAIRKKGPRIIVFAVSGNIALESELDINNGDLTIAGQSAPGGGITLKNYPLNIKADNVIVRYLRFRLGDEKGVQEDAVSGNKGKNNIIVDHCSMSWATDEVASFYRNANFTLQWCIISESLNHSVHAKGDHGYGGIWGGAGASFHHNLIAHHMSRMPRFSGSKSTSNSPNELVDFRNNVIFNWGGDNIYGGEKGRYNVTNNYFKPGPATPDSKKKRIIQLTPPVGSFYVSGNVMEGSPEVSKNNVLGVETKDKDSIEVKLRTEAYAVIPISEQPAEKAFELVLKHAGASYQRDAVDQRLVKEVQTGVATSGKSRNGIIDSQQDVGGWPLLKSAPAPADQDQDGMPDAWEKKHKLDPKNPADAAAYTLDQQYTNIEVYLNGLVQMP